MNRNGKPIINMQSRETGEMIIQTEEMNDIKLTREYNIFNIYSCFKPLKD